MSYLISVKDNGLFFNAGLSECGVLLYLALGDIHFVVGDGENLLGVGKLCVSQRSAGAYKIPALVTFKCQLAVSLCKNLADEYRNKINAILQEENKLMEIVKLIGADNIKTIDSMLRMVQSMTGSQDKDKIQDSFYKKLEELDYDELEEKEFTIGGEKVSCGGYETTMTGEFIYDLMDTVYEEAYGKGISDMMDELADMGADVSDTEEFESTIKDMDEIDVKYYLNDGKFAMLNFATESDDGDLDVEVYFEGKDIPWHEMTIKNVESDQEVKLTTEDKDECGKLLETFVSGRIPEGEHTSGWAERPVM